MLKIDDHHEKDLQQASTFDQREPFYIVGVGASAGGLEALERMFQAMPEDSGMAFVIVQHLSPDFKSVMDELLARHTKMAIHRVEDGMQVEPNSLYLIPAKQEMIITGGKLLLTEKDPNSSLSLPIDHFLRSLAQDAGSQGIAVVLSGTGSDGSRGIRDVHEAGGLVIAQSPESAKFDGMPKSAIDTGLVDIVSDPGKIPDILDRYAKHPFRSQFEQRDAPVDETSLQHVFRLLQQRHKIDFAYYKPSTIGRRIERRIQLNHHGDLDEYVARLEEDPSEVDLLYKDLLIGVTRFFRDGEAFEILRNDVLPQLLMAHNTNEEFRVWVAACGTGEEAYSIAILIDECMRAMNRRLPVKIFATDVHQTSLDIAHPGIYPETALEEMTAARRTNYFNKVESGYQVLPEVRKMIVFAPHNLVKDAPFTHLHLITCRNLLIYLRTMAQKKVISLFHFGLKAGGVLFMGASESPGELSDEFDTLHERWKIYRKSRDVRLPTDFRSFGYPAPITREARSQGRSAAVSADGDLIATYDELLDQFMPPAFLIDEKGGVLQMFGGAGKFLKIRDGRMSTSVLDLVDGDLRLALTGALQRVSKSAKPVTCERVRIDTSAGQQFLRIDVQPVSKYAHETKFLVALHELDQPQTPEEPSEEIDLGEVSRNQNWELEQELRYTKESLQAAIEELETSNEELQATNEELVASNEELQSTNEELHSINEELYTVNAEYQRKIAELTELTNDMDNLLLSTKIHTLFLDEQLCIRKFTPDIAEVFNLINSDIGRKIDGFTHRLDCDDLVERLSAALEGEEHEEEVSHSDGRIYLLRILPYLSNGKPAGAVLTLIDITAQKAVELELDQREQSLGQERARLKAVMDQSLCIIFLKDRSGRYVELNQFGATNLGKPRDAVVGRTDVELFGEAGEDSHELDMQVIAKEERKAGEVLLATSCGQRVFYTLRSPLRDAHGHVVGSCGISVDITDRKAAESSLAQEVARRDEFLAMLSHELRNPMGAVQNALEVLDAEQPDQEVPLEHPRHVIKRQTRHMARLLDDLLDIARLGQGKIEFRKEIVDLASLSDDVLEAVRYEVQAKHQKLHVDVAEGPLHVMADPARIRQAQVNLLTNASKYTPESGEIWYDMARDGENVVVTVRDSGEGIPDDLLQGIFDMFVQGESTLARSSGGMGVGLSLARGIVEAHGGTILAHSDGPGSGSTFTIQLPLTDRTPRPQPPKPHVSFDGCKLLLVEDNEDARTMLTKALRLQGFEVTNAPDGKAAIEAFRSFRPEVAVIDIGLPVMNGYELAKQVRADDKLAGTMLIALTGYGRETDRQKALHSGFDAHLVKPLDPGELYELIGARRNSRQGT